MQILFIGHTRIGDAVLSTGILEALTDQYPGARITVACGTIAAPLYKPAPFVERVIPIVKRRFNLHWFEFWRQVVTTRWDLVIDLRNSAIPWFVRARQRIIYRGGLLPGEHTIVSFARLLQLQDTPPSPRLWATNAQLRAAEKLIPEGGPVLALGPIANWPGKIWPAERFAELVLRLTGEASTHPMRGARVAILAGIEDRDRVRPIFEAIPKDCLIDIVGTADLPTVYACLQRCTLYVGNDSGLMHIAAAAGIPTVGLFGPSLPVHFGPWGERNASVRTRRPYEELVRDPGYDDRATGTLMDSLEIDDVVSAVDELFDVSAPEIAK